MTASGRAFWVIKHVLLVRVNSDLLKLILCSSRGQDPNALGYSNNHVYPLR